MHTPVPIESTDATSASSAWLRYLSVAGPAFLLWAVWASPWLASVRPAPAWGSDWQALLAAWLPEALLMAGVAFAAQRLFAAARKGLPAVQPGGVIWFVLLWLALWALGVFLPTGLLLYELAQALAPLKNVFLQGGFAGLLLAGGMGLLLVGLYTAGASALLVLAWVWACCWQKPLRHLAQQGQLVRPSCIPGVTRLAVPALLGMLYWLVRLLAWSWLYAAPWTLALLDALTSLLLIGVYAAATSHAKQQQPDFDVMHWSNAPLNASGALASDRVPHAASVDVPAAEPAARDESAQ